MWCEVVHDRREVAGAELGVVGPGVEEGGRRGGEMELGEDVVKFDRAFVLLFFFIQGKAHRDAHPEDLGRFQAALLMVEEVAVVEGLQPEIGELVVALDLHGAGEFVEVEVEQFGADSVDADGVFEIFFKVVAVGDSRDGIGSGRSPSSRGRGHRAAGGRRLVE